MNLTERVHNLYEATSTVVKQAAVGAYVAAPIVMASMPAWGHPHQETETNSIPYVLTSLAYGLPVGVVGTLLTMAVAHDVKRKQYRSAALTAVVGVPATILGMIIFGYAITKGMEIGARLAR